MKTYLKYYAILTLIFFNAKWVTWNHIFKKEYVRYILHEMYSHFIEINSYIISKNSNILF